MATLYISEFAGLASGMGQSVQVAQLPPLAQQTRTVSAAAASAAAFGAGTRLVRLQTDTACFIAIDEAATVAKMPLSANVPEYFSVKPGSVLSAITA